MNPIITSILDNDLYKFSMAAVVCHYFDTDVTYQFNNRNKSVKFSPEFLVKLNEQIEAMKDVVLTLPEYQYLEKTFPFLPKWYIEYLYNYRFNPQDVHAYLDDESQLQITIKGKWSETILWEVPLMAIISELYFEEKPLTDEQNKSYYELTKDKYWKLWKNGCLFSDFGTRRRRSKSIQDMVVSTFTDIEGKGYNCFMGTSNVRLAMDYNIPCLGTQAHEWIMGCSAFCDLKYAHETALSYWSKFYRGKLGIALTDTFTSDAFLKDFDGYYARLYDGVRHDSGDALVFTDKVIKHYETLGINPNHKRIIFSDGLNVEECIKIHKHCEGRINHLFGIGTNLSNHQMDEHKPLNMVIKLRTVNGKEVVKISDNPIKATGDSKALAKAFQVFGIKS